MCGCVYVKACVCVCVLKNIFIFKIVYKYLNDQFNF